MLSVSIKANLPYLLLGVVTAILYGCPDSVKLTLEYNRLAIAEGELWRLISGHLLHSNLAHLLLNLAGLLVIMLLYAPFSKRLAFGWQLVILSLGISIGLWLFASQITHYVGLSGVLHGILCYGAVLDIRQGHRSGWLILLGLFGKLVYEHYYGPDVELGALIAAEVAIEAHLYGAIVGLLLGLLLFNRTPRQ